MEKGFENQAENEFGKKVVIANKDKTKRGFKVTKSLDQSVEPGELIDWFKIKNLCNEGYTTILHDQEKPGGKYGSIRATPADEINTFMLNKRYNEKPSSVGFRDIYDNLTERNPIIINGNHYLDFFKNKQK